MKPRLDMVLVERGLAPSREAAQRLILAGLVRSGSQILDKPGHKVAADIQLEVRGNVCPYVSLGGLKLAAALTAFAVPVTGRRCLDIGASTGGFTDCLLQAGAAHVTALDVGYGQLAWKLRNDARVVVVERTNFREIPLSALGEPFALVVTDVSFISLSMILPRAVEVLTGDGEVLALIKPQFEAGRDAVARGGLVRDAAVHLRVVADLRASLGAVGLHLWGLEPVPVVDPRKNIEFMSHWRQSSCPTAPDVEGVVARAHERWQIAANAPGAPTGPLAEDA